MNRLWVETLSVQGSVLARQRLDQPVIHIGLDYDNDLIFDDAYFQNNNLKITRLEDGDWLAEAAGEGMQVQGVHGLVKSYLLHGDAIITVGKTRLRFRSRNYVSQPFIQTGAAAAPTTVHGKWLSWRTVGGLVGVTLLLIMLESWLADTTKFEISRYLSPVIGYGVGVLIWSSIWALLSRLFSGQAHFRMHLIIGLAGVLLISLLNDLLALAGFSFGWMQLGSVTQYLVWVMIAAWCYAHLRAIGSTHKTIKALVVSLLALAIVGSQLMFAHENAAREVEFRRLSALMPPYLHIGSKAGVETFFADVQKMKEDLDEERKKEPPTSGGRF